MQVRGQGQKMVYGKHDSSKWCLKAGRFSAYHDRGVLSLFNGSRDATEGVVRLQSEELPRFDVLTNLSDPPTRGPIESIHQLGSNRTHQRVGAKQRCRLDRE